MKKLLLWFFLCLGVVTMVTPSISHATESAFWKWSSVNATKELSIWWVEDGEIKRENRAIDVIKWFVNWILWLWWLIVLIMLIYGWILMVTSQWDEEKYSKWRKVMRAALIWIAIIWVAWFIVSLGLWLGQQAWNPADGSSALTEI